MAFITGGLSGTDLEIDSATRAARVSARPMQVLGAYSVGVSTSGLAGLTNTADVCAFRWTDPDALALISRVRVRATYTVAFSAAQQTQLALSVATGFTVAHSSGAITTSGTALRRRQTYPVSRVGSINVSSTGALGGATRTLNPNPLVLDNRWVAAGGAQQDFGVSFAPGNGHPIVLAANEGLIVHNLITMGAAGTAVIAVDIDWVEVLPADYAV